MDVAARLRAVPEPGRPHAPAGRPAVRRRAADAGDRPGAAHQSPPPADGRAVRGARAGDRRADQRGPGGPAPGRAGDLPGRAELRPGPGAADVIYILSKGQVVWQGTAGELAGAAAVRETHLGV